MAVLSEASKAPYISTVAGDHGREVEPAIEAEAAMEELPTAETQ